MVIWVMPAQDGIREKALERLRLGAGTTLETQCAKQRKKVILHYIQIRTAVFCSCQKIRARKRRKNLQNRLTRIFREQWSLNLKASLNAEFLLQKKKEERQRKDTRSLISKII